jgi:ABC-type transporter Mla subunit MlaD
MKRLFFLGALALALACRREEEPPKPGGAVVQVLFDERHDLSGGEPVRFHDFEVGRVEKVDLAEARVRATLSIDPEVAAQLTRESTFSVESDDAGLYLLAHVFDPEAEKLREGGTLEGVDSGLELTVRRASSEASRFFSGIGSSEWMQEAKDLVSDMEREVEEVDWGEKEKEVREQLDAARKAVDETAGATSEQAKESFRKMREQMDRLVEELRELGRSEQAQKLQDQIEKLFGADSEGK